MKRLRTLRFRSYVLPLILAAIAGRALAPESSVTAESSSPVLATSMCSLDKERRERLSIPDESLASPRCFHCLNGPMGWAPIAFLNIGVTTFRAPLATPAETPQDAGIAMLRNQAARAPPYA